MAVSLPNGATISIGSTFGSSKAMSAVSNASEAVATLEASHGVVENDILVITSGWSGLNGRVVRADSVATNDVTLEDINTSSTTTYPAGSGTGSVVEVTAWTQITQILDSAFAGGESQFTNYSFLEDARERQIPTQKSAESLTLTIADDQSLTHWSVLAAADLARTPYPIRVSLPSGAKLYYNGYVTFNQSPSLTKNEVMGVQCTVSFVADPTRYSA